MNLDTAIKATEDLIDYLAKSIKVIKENRLDDVEQQKLLFYFEQTIFYIEECFRKEPSLFFLKYTFPVLYQCSVDIYRFKRNIWDQQREAGEKDHNIWPEEKTDIEFTLKEVKDWIQIQPMTEEEKEMFLKYRLILKTEL